jgi:N-methylhydantoinase A/oxoprolinase/acetone carboxylase beta subunit
MHPYAGVLSAYGMGLADIGALRERTVELPLEPEQMAAVEAMLDELAAEATAEVRAHIILEASCTSVFASTFDVYTLLPPQSCTNPLDATPDSRCNSLTTTFDVGPSATHTV